VIRQLNSCIEAMNFNSKAIHAVRNTKTFIVRRSFQSVVPHATMAGSIWLSSEGCTIVATA